MEKTKVSLQNIPEKPETAKKKEYLLVFSLAIILTLAYQCIRLNTINFNHKNKLDPIQDQLERAQSQLNYLSQENKNLKRTLFEKEVALNKADSYEPRCPYWDLSTLDLDKGDFITKDGEYFLWDMGGSQIFCSSTPNESGNRQYIGPIEARVQNNEWLVISTYAGIIFFANYEDMALEYITIDDFPNKERYETEDGSYRMSFFGPQQYQYDYFSPDSTKVIFGASDCHDCSTVPDYYVYNLITGEVTYIGVGRVPSWVDNNTVKLRGVKISSPMVEENLGYTTTKVN